MKSKSLLCLAMFSSLIGCKGDGGGGDNGITAAPNTALHHAQVCREELGKIPTWACQDGVQIPRHVGG